MGLRVRQSKPYGEDRNRGKTEGVTNMKSEPNLLSIIKKNFLTGGKRSKDYF